MHGVKKPSKGLPAVTLPDQEANPNPNPNPKGKANPKKMGVAKICRKELAEKQSAIHTLKTSADLMAMAQRSTPVEADVLNGQPGRSDRVDMQMTTMRTEVEDSQIAEEAMRLEWVPERHNAQRRAMAMEQNLQDLRTAMRALNPCIHTPQDLVP